MASLRPISLPRQWPRHVKAGILHAISLAGVALSYARGRASGRRRLLIRVLRFSACPRHPGLSFALDTTSKVP